MSRLHFEFFGGPRLLCDNVEVDLAVHSPSDIAFLCMLLWQDIDPQTSSQLLQDWSSASIANASTAVRSLVGEVAFPKRSLKLMGISTDADILRGALSNSDTADLGHDDCAKLLAWLSQHGSDSFLDQISFRGAAFQWRGEVRSRIESLHDDLRRLQRSVPNPAAAIRTQVGMSEVIPNIIGTLPIGDTLTWLESAAGPRTKVMVGPKWSGKKRTVREALRLTKGAWQVVAWPKRLDTTREVKVNTLYLHVSSLQEVAAKRSEIERVIAACNPDSVRKCLLLCEGTSDGDRSLVTCAYPSVADLRIGISEEAVNPKFPYPAALVELLKATELTSVVQGYERASEILSDLFSPTELTRVSVSTWLSSATADTSKLFFGSSAPFEPLGRSFAKILGPILILRSLEALLNKGDVPQGLRQNLRFHNGLLHDLVQSPLSEATLAVFERSRGADSRLFQQLAAAIYRCARYRDVPNAWMWAKQMAGGSLDLRAEAWEFDAALYHFHDVITVETCNEIIVNLGNFMILHPGEEETLNVTNAAVSVLYFGTWFKMRDRLTDSAKRVIGKALRIALREDLVQKLDAELPRGRPLDTWVNVLVCRLYTNLRIGGGWTDAILKLCEHRLGPSPDTILAKGVSLGRAHQIADESFVLESQLTRLELAYLQSQEITSRLEAFEDEVIRFARINRNGVVLCRYQIDRLEDTLVRLSVSDAESVISQLREGLRGLGGGQAAAM